MRTDESVAFVEPSLVRRGQCKATYRRGDETMVDREDIASQRRQAIMPLKKVLASLKSTESALLIGIREKSLLVLILILVFFLFSIFLPYFFQARNFIIILRQNNVKILLASALTIIIISGGMDLSIGSILAFCSVLSAIVMKQKVPGAVIYAVLAGLAAGALLGMFNGLLTVKLKIDPWLVTLATLTLIRGFAYAISRGQVIGDIPNNFLDLLTAHTGPFPNMLWICLLVILVLQWLLTSTTWGLRTRAIGANRLASIYCGISVNRNVVVLYGLSGFVAAIGGFMVIGEGGSTTPYIANGIELDSIAGAVIGGTSFNGGIGSISGTVLGVLLIGVIQDGLAMTGLSTSYLRLSRGLILLVVVFLAAIRQSARQS